MVSDEEGMGGGTQTVREGKRGSGVVLLQVMGMILRQCQVTAEYEGASRVIMCEGAMA